MPLINRRRFGTALASIAGSWTASYLSAAPALLTGSAPQVSDGVASGDVTRSEAVLWSRSDRAARMCVEWSDSAAFTQVRRRVGPVTGPSTDFTAKILLRDLPSGQRIHYRIGFEDSHGHMGYKVAGSLLTAPATPKTSIRFAWSGDTCGQGWGIDADRGGLRTYDALLRQEPDFFIHSGDTIYADVPIPPRLTLPNGTFWKNRVTQEKSKPAESLNEFRGNHRYNLLDANVQRFNAQVPVFAQWDDHEVMNNWYPGQRLSAESGYTARQVDLLAARSRQAFFEYQPIRDSPSRLIHRRIRRGPLCDLFFLDLRSFRGPNSGNRQPIAGPDSAFLGASQLAWIKEELVASTAVWKFVCSDMPLGLRVQDGLSRFEACANGDGPPLGRELEIANLLRHLKGHGVRNVVWLTADVHYAASHFYSPVKAQFTEFDGFWEFVSGPLHAGTFGPSTLDNTFGPEVRFSSRQPGDSPTGPWSPHQFFGTVDIAPISNVATVTHFNRDGDRLWRIDLPPSHA